MNGTYLFTIDLNIHRLHGINCACSSSSKVN